MMPVIHVHCLADTLSALRHRFQTRVVTADPHGVSSIYDVALTGNVCIVLGNEDSGVRPEVTALASERVAIPMCNQTDSLNVGSASAVFLYEACRQRAAATG